MTDLSSRYLGMTLPSAIVASASPLTMRIDVLRQLEDAGVGAVVLPSLFEEQLEQEEIEIDRMLNTEADAFMEAQSFFPELADYNTGPDEYLETVGKAREVLDIPVIASLNGITMGGWTRYATELESAGAAGLELNVYRVAADPNVTGQEVEEDTIELVRTVNQAVRIPVAIKLSPFFSSLANFAVRLDEAGVDGLVLFNRFYQPDLDLETLEPVPSLELSTSAELRLPLRWMGLLSGRVKCSLAATTGVHTWADAAKVLLAGADVACMTSSILRHGPDWPAKIIHDLRRWMEDEEYESIEQLKGSASSLTGPNPQAYERANYISTVASYAPRW